MTSNATSTDSPPSRTHKQGSKKLLWIGWDGADWEHINPMIDAGLLPTLEKFINTGAMGNLGTMNPMLSPMLWNSAATGKYPDQHGIHGFVEPDDKNGGARPFSSHSRKSKAVWNICSQNGLKSNVINWWASHPAEEINGCVVSNLISGVNPNDPVSTAAKNLIHPADRAARYLRNRVLPSEVTAEQLLPFCPKAAEVDQETDGRLEALATVFAEMLTTHAVATDIMEHEPWDFMAVYYTAVDHFSHAFMGYHPPRLPGVPEKDFEMYKDVVTGCYRFTDMMLERMLSMCDEDTTVLICSDHGFQSRDQRPASTPRESAGPAIWHREYGMIAVNGPGVKKDALIHGANLIDIAPTILTILDLPVGEDMAGRPLLELFENPPEVNYIPSWEDVDGDDGMRRVEPDIAPEEASELVKQFVALGYIEDPGDNREKQHTSARVECAYNLARSLIFTGQPARAHGMLSDLSHEFPWETRFIVQWIAAAKQAGYYGHCMRLIEAAYDLESTPSLQMAVMWCECKIILRQSDPSVLQRLENLSLMIRKPMVLVQVAALYIRLKEFEAAKMVLLRVLNIHQENAVALSLIARVYYIGGQHEEAINAALGSLALVHRDPSCHLTLGMALARSGNLEQSVVAFETAAKFAGKNQNAHRWLRAVHTRLGNDDQAQYHRRRSIEIQNSSKSENQNDVSSKSNDTPNESTTIERCLDREFPIPEFQTEVERYNTLDQKRPPNYNTRKLSGKTRVIVSGLPRSGTSMMMQMLEAGGLMAKTDGLREADSDNPKGYYEWEDIKQIGHDFRILNSPDLDDKAIKVISMLLPNLPMLHEYKVIFLTRPIAEVTASQTKMLQNNGEAGGDLDQRTMAKEMIHHRASALVWLKQNKRAQCLEISYSKLLADPEAAVQSIVEFLGEDRLPHADKMAAVVDPVLYRQREQVKS